MTKTSRQGETNSATSIDVVIADPNSTVVLSKQHNLDESGPTNQPLIERHDEAIRRLAYQKWEAAGSPAGEGTEFWLEAEQEIKVD